MSNDVQQVLAIIAFAVGIVLALAKRGDWALAAVSGGLLITVL